MSKKELPEGYVCNACGSSEHSIHECPKKVSKKKSDKVDSNTIVKSSKNTKIKFDHETHDIVKKDRKIFISGLPFDTTKPKLQKMLEDEGCKVQFIQLITFEDNPKKCRGLSYVTLKDHDSVTKALQLNGKECGNKILKVEESHTHVEKNNSIKPVKKSRCYRCGGDHDPNTCTNQRICYKCKSFDHISKDCPLKSKSS